MIFIKATQFKSQKIRDLTQGEMVLYSDVCDVYNYAMDFCIIGEIPSVASIDRKHRPLFLHASIVSKIRNKHGDFVIDNLLINANDWDFIICNMDHNNDKINLVKMIPGQDIFLIIGAIRNNGFFMLTHFETQVIQGNELKSLLGRGDFYSRDT